MSRTALRRSIGLLVVACPQAALAQSPPAAPATDAPAPVVGPVVAPVAPAIAGAESAARAEAPATRWYDEIQLGGFVDGYASVNWNFPRPASPTALGGGNQFRAFDTTQGFALHWVGVDASFAPQPIGGTVSLRFGPGAALYSGAAESAIGLQNVKQAFVSWKPSERVVLDFGKFDQPYGAEVADSQGNLSYTRGLVFWYLQPLYFTGVRATFALGESVEWKLLAVNGWNASADVNLAKSLGTQLNFKPSGDVLVSLGYLVGAEQPNYTTCAADTTYDTATRSCAASPGSPGALVDRGGADKRLRHLVDFVVDVSPTPALRFLANADWGAEKVYDPATAEETTVTYWGASLAGRYAFASSFYAALRGEYLADEDGFATLGAYTAPTGREVKLASGTLTLGYSPTDHIVLKLDQRMDRSLGKDANGDVDELFQKKIRDTAAGQMTTTLGVVVKTN
jgi:hypothetical protein